MRKLVKMQEDIQHWRTKIASSSREWVERNGALRREKELMGKHYSQLKAALDATRQQHADRLKTLSFATAAAAAELERKLAKASSILRLAEVCRRLETEQEKVLPFWSLDEAVPVKAADEAVESTSAMEAEQAAAVQQSAGAGEASISFAGSSKRISSYGGGAKARLTATALQDDGSDVEEFDYLNMCALACLRCGRPAFQLFGFSSL